jgi:hypothetical protein
MRKRQISLLFAEEKESEDLWTSIPSKSQTEIARLYARLLIKSAKAVMGGARVRGEDDDEQ